MNVAILIQSLATISWVLFIAAIVITVLRSSRGKPTKGFIPIIIAGLVLALLFSSASAGVVFIQPEERGVVVSALQPAGYREQALQPGLRWVIPFFENVVRYTISRQTYTMSIASSEGQIEGDDSILARTADGQEVKVDASVIFAIDPTKTVMVHIEWQNRYTDGLVRPLARGVIRDAISQFGIEEVVSSKRIEMTQIIRDEMFKKLGENGLVLVEFILRNISFSEEYAASVEQKQIAEQLSFQAKFVVEQKKQEAEQARQVAQGMADSAVIKAEGDAEARIIQAEAEAKALELIADALRDNPDLLTYQYISKLAPGIQVMLVPNDTPYLLPLPSLETDTSTLFEVSPTPVPTP